MNFSEQPPSKQWVAVKFKGVKFVQVWFKPEGEPLALRFRVPQSSFQLPEIRERLTIETLVKAVALATKDVESWRQGDVFHTCIDKFDFELRNLLPQPPQDLPHLDIYLRLKPAPEVEAPEESEVDVSDESEVAASEENQVEASEESQVAPPEESQVVASNEREVVASNESEVVAPRETPESEIPLGKFQDLEARWNAILGVEAGIETLRLKMDGVRAELEACWNKTLTPEERLHALKADVAQWTKAKTRVHYAVPKVKEFVHRATWALGAPERKRLDELFKNYIELNIPFPQVDRVSDQLESLLKDRQILSAQGVTVHQECKNIVTDIQKYLARLQSNAATRANKERNAKRSKGKFFKDVRRMTGAD